MNTVERERYVFTRFNSLLVSRLEFYVALFLPDNTDLTLLRNWHKGISIKQLLVQVEKSISFIFVFFSHE